ncbi:haloacid dehalogenase, type II [Aspergillus clavatus NRRL 1]|uniref:Haloacid dehalogenase, type II n=1 Tax=Aspergillus clavatus (strain ATCC 1007 / CBS 513.65 / DSM 816 / NCTC 3887 / NRRL 1 / QM 1276 / 107) TaxID=344612 RepID=A1CSK3_ASPCL|nr:haloacid dehalogenase, type II [Aspergillus clavatus NRRL 1]EAW06290.1 haloacid dehalogenase, type II [Aspergillus clavatus NRRL 1]
MTQPALQVLFFDVFGTVVEWRTCVTNALHDAAQHALQDPDRHLPDDLRAKASNMTPTDWLALAEAWRRSYQHFTSTADTTSQPFISVDEHHHRALIHLLHTHHLTDLFTAAETQDLSLSWHRLQPWPDAVRGLDLLNRKFRTCTLSNGNIALLEGLQRYGALPFTHILSAEHFGTYKPAPEVYHGAAERFGLRPGECAMVAAHLEDLKAAKACGMRTVYVERPEEEEDLDIEQERREGYVDIWVAGGDGFVEVARRLGIAIEGDV